LNESVQYFDKSIGIDPQLAEAWYHKGFALYALGMHERAKEAFEKVNEIDSTIKIPSALTANSIPTS